MNKRGELLTVAIIAFVVVAGSLIAGSYFATRAPDQYVGDITSKKYYHYNCISEVAEGSRVLFENETTAQKLNFTYCEC
jgi:hypothetical protein